MTTVTQPSESGETDTSAEKRRGDPMKASFNPDEIALKKFVIRWRGYDTREVEAFLRAVAVDFRRLIDRLADADVADADVMKPDLVGADLEKPDLVDADPAEADPSDATGDELARARADLVQLSSQLDRALAYLEDLESMESADPSRSAGPSDPGAGPAELAGMARLDRNAELRLLSAGTGRD
jgi:DivIVA domain-containing protein